MKTAIVAAAASLLALAAPASAQNPQDSRAAHRHRHGYRPHAEYRLRVDRSAPARYGSSDVYVREGRASAPEVPVPGFAWRPASQHEGVGADLVGPGSSAENPTGQHDVSR